MALGPRKKPAADRIRDAIDGAELYDDCPVKALGESVEGGRFFFLSRSGKVRPLTHRDLTRSGIDSLFVGNTDWLVATHPQLDRKGNPTDDWDADKARSDLLKRCDGAGYFDPDRQIRGPGTWRDDDGGLIIHCGDRVLIGECWEKAGFVHQGNVYPTYPRKMPPPISPASEADVADLLEFINRWNWRWAEGAGRVLLGWIFASMICGALDWRPHIWVVGGRNRGKTTLQKLVFGILGDMLFRASDPSGPGIRNTLNGAAVPVALDEVEFDPSNRRAQDCVDLARLASTDDQGATYRANTTGGSHSWNVRACFYFTSIIKAPMKPQDRQRITVLDIDKIKDRKEKQYVAQKIRRFAELAPALHARMIAGFDRFQENMIIFDEAMSDQFSGRVADQFGTMLAVAETMLSDTPADLDDVKAFLREIDIEPHVDDDDMEEAEECLNWLLSWPADLWRSGERQTIGSLILTAIEGLSGETRKALPRLGVKLLPRTGRPTYLAVASHHNNLHRVFDETKFAKRGWVDPLKEFNKGVPLKSVNFAGAHSRAVLIPIEVIKRKDEDGDDGSDPGPLSPDTSG